MWPQCHILWNNGVFRWGTSKTTGCRFIKIAALLCDVCRDSVKRGRNFRQNNTDSRRLILHRTTSSSVVSVFTKQNTSFNKTLPLLWNGFSVFKACFYQETKSPVVGLLRCSREAHLVSTSSHNSQEGDWSECGRCSTVMENWTWNVTVQPSKKNKMLQRDGHILFLESLCCNHNLEASCRLASPNIDSWKVGGGYLQYSSWLCGRNAFMFFLSTSAFREFWAWDWHPYFVHFM